MYRQQSLDLDFHNRLTFSSYYISEKNSTAVNYLLKQLDIAGTVTYIWGGAGVGKSHLLQAISDTNFKANRPVSYLPLENITDYSVEMLESLESYAVILIDDIHLIAGKEDWEEAAFHLFNRVTEHGMTMIVSSSGTPSSVGIKLPDLVSRLSWGAVFNLHALEDEEKITALVLHATERGLILPRQTAQFLLSRCHRNMAYLISVLHKLDQASMEEQRKITIPFIKKTLFD